MDRVWSKYSLDIFDAYSSGTDNLLVQACPGAGKTTNIEQLWRMDSKATCYLVFNKKNQEDAQGKLPRKAGSSVLTINSLGHRILMANFDNVTLDQRKIHGIVKDTVKYNARFLPKSFQREQEWQLIKAVGQMKQVCLSSEPTEQEYQATLDFYDLESYAGMYADVLRVLETSDQMTGVIDFADQIRLPALYNLQMPAYPRVLIDEAQDLSPIQAKLISKLDAERYILVGDEHQSIYAFRGAMNDSMAYLKGHFGCIQMPLSITYRCAKQIVADAAQIYPDIEPWEESPEGIVGVGWRDRQGQQISPVYDRDTLVVCRNNAPLIAEAYRLLAEGIPCHVRGRAIGEGLQTLVKRMEATDIRQLIDRLGEWRELEVQKATIKEDDTRLQKIEDQFSSLMVLITRCNMVDSPLVVLAMIAELFAEGRGCTLSTVHKAKGLEATRCYLLEHGLFAAGISRARYPWQVVQERNIQYVAVTRAKRELVYC